MNSNPTLPQTIDDYISQFPEAVQDVLQRVRAVIRETAPEAQEAIKYGIPTFILHGNLVHFAGYKMHIGFYPAPSGMDKFKDGLSGYLQAKGSVQFPLDQPIPYDLIREIVQFRVTENLARVKPSKKTSKTA